MTHKIKWMLPSMMFAAMLSFPVTAMAQKEMVQTPQQLFTIYDTDRSGSLNMDEYLEYFKEHPDANETDAAQAFSRLDINKDQKLNLDELEGKESRIVR